MTLREQVARALCEAMDEDPDAMSASHPDWRGWHQYAGSATAAIRVALEALRGVDVVMREDGQVVHELRGAPSGTWKMLVEAAIRQLGGDEDWRTQ